MPYYYLDLNSSSSILYAGAQANFSFQRLGYIICKGGNNSTYLIVWGVSKLISVQCFEDWPAYQQILSIDTLELCF